MNNADFESVAIKTLVSDLIGLNPQALASMAEQPTSLEGDPSPETVWDGLNRFVRKVLAGYLALANVDRAAVRLKDETSARANGWPDARTANVAMALIWALLAEDRDLKGLSPVPLLRADPASVTCDPVIEGTEALSTYELCRRVLSLELTEEMEQRRQGGIARPADGARVTSIGTAINEILGLDSASLEAFLETKVGSGISDLDADMRVRIALNLIVRGAICQFYTMRDRGVEEVRLMTNEDARDAGKPDARTANFATLVATALHCEDGRAVVIYPPRSHGPEYEALLRRLAAFAIRDGSRRAVDAIEALCERDVHFGATSGPGKHSRLLLEAYAQREAGAIG